MKRFWVVFGAAVGSIVALLAAGIAIVLWFIFTPERLTPIVARQLPRFVTCETAVERVELTFFSSFPHLELQIEGVVLGGSPMADRVRTDGNAASLVRLERLGARVDVRTFLMDKTLVLSDIELHKGAIDARVDSLGRGNWDIFRADPQADTLNEGGFEIERIDVDFVTLHGLDVRYADAASGLEGALAGLSGTVAAKMNGKLAAAKVDLTASGVGFAMGGSRYLSDAALALTVDADADIAAQAANIKKLSLRVNDLALELDGSVRNDSLRGIETDLRYRFADWRVRDVLALIPADFGGYLEGISLSGALSSEGTVRGFYASATEMDGGVANAGEKVGADSGAAITARPGSMPTIDANVVLAGAEVGYPAVLPWPLRGVEANLSLHTDLSDEGTYVSVNSLSARLPRSTVRVRGRLDRIFSDPHASLTADVSADLADAKPFLPADLPVTARGRVSGTLLADARMSQITRMAIDKMRISGDFKLSDIDAKYDTISVKTPSARLEFALPNHKPTSRTAGFAAVSLAADRMDAQMGAETEAAMNGAKISAEISNVLDPGQAMAAVCDFAFADLAAKTGSMSVSASAPSGRVSIGPARDGGSRYLVALRSGSIAGTAAETRIGLGSMDVEATVKYDSLQPSLWQKLSPRGHVKVGGFVARTPALSYPVEVPALEMDFTPRQFNIAEARVKLDESDFSLDGSVSNILPYFRKEGDLVAEFNFNSPVTNVSQLLALTNGIGGGDANGSQDGSRNTAKTGTASAASETGKASAASKTATETDSAPKSDEFSGPYMVPLGIDIMLHAAIKEALWEGEPLFSNIKGDVQVKNGAIFISPQLSFNSPMTDGRLQLMYRTPDRNNLFTSLSLHLNNIEMQELVDKIPNVEELLPMLRGFNGQGEFHCAAEGYMDSTYNYKIATLRGAGSLIGTNLTLKDDEIFRKVAFALKYKDEGVLRVDSLRAEFSVFRDVIDVYPFLLKMDRYGAVISGTHRLSGAMDYNISLVESPIPFRVAVDIKGDPENLQFKVFSKSRYPDFYRPKYEGVTESREMELRNIIRDRLLQ